MPICFQRVSRRRPKGGGGGFTQRGWDTSPAFFLEVTRAN